MKHPATPAPGHVPGMRRFWPCGATAIVALAALLWLHAAIGQPTPGPATQPAQDAFEPSVLPPDFGPGPPRRPGRPPHRPPGLMFPEEHPLEAQPPPNPPPEPLWQVLNEFYPDEVRQLEALRKDDPAAFARIERQVRPWLGRLHEARGRNPELARLMVLQHRTEMQIRDWRGRWNAAGPDASREALLDEAHRLAQQRVDLRLERQRLEIEMFERRLAALKQNLESRQAARPDLVEHELDALLHGPASQPAPPLTVP